jgi:hypothetical protein
MMTVARLRRKPRHFHAFTGLTPVEFDRLLLELEPAYHAHHQERHERPDRQRAFGGGRRGALPLAERLLMGLVSLRLYVSQGMLSYLFDLDESNISRELNQRLFPVLLLVLPVPLRDAPLRAVPQDPSRNPSPKDETGKPKGTAPKPKGTSPKQIRTVEELFQAHPELKEALVDATEQEVPKPKDKPARKQRFSGKHHQHTVKTQVITTPKQILHVFGGVAGCVADVQLLRASGVLRKLPNGVKVRLDRGFDGIENDYPDVDFQSPIKGRRGHSVTVFGKAYNRMLNRQRIAVEHVLSRLKKFGSLAGVFRGRFEAHEDVFCIVSGLVNFKATGQFQLTSD